MRNEPVDGSSECSVWPSFSAGVKDGVVTLSGRMTLRKDVRIAVCMTHRVNGVVDVIDDLKWDVDDTPTRTGR